MSASTLAVHSFPADSALPPVVLLHGFASSGQEDWIAMGWPEALNAAGRSVLVLDLPGHGDSPAVDAGAAGTAAVVDAIVGSIAATGALEVDVIAYSLGSRLAWDLAGRGGVRRLVLGGLSPFEPFAGVDTQELAAVASGSAEPSSPIVGMMAGMVSAPGTRTDSLIALIGGLAAEPFDPAAGAPGVPTLVVAGEDDMMTGGIDAVVEALPDARLERVPGDHRGALDSPEFRAAAIAFVAEDAAAR